MAYIMLILASFVIALYPMPSLLKASIDDASTDDQKPNTFKQYLHMWKTYVGQNRLKDALQILKDIPLDQKYEYHDYLDYLWACGSTYRKLNHQDVAQQFFTKIIHSRTAQSYHFWWIVGNAHKALGDKTQAISCWEKALTFADSKNHTKEMVILYYNIGQTAIADKEYQEAIDALKHATTLNPSVAVYDALGTAYRKIGNISDSLVCYKKAVELDPQWINSINNIGICYYKQKKIKLAVQQFKKAITLDPLHYQAYVHLGKHYILKKKKKRALSCLKSAYTLLKEGMAAQKIKIQKYIDKAEKL